MQYIQEFIHDLKGFNINKNMIQSKQVVLTYLKILEINYLCIFCLLFLYMYLVHVKYPQSSEFQSLFIYWSC